MKKTAKKPTDYNSSINQDIKGQFVAREVKACFSYEMDAVLKAGGEGPGDLPTFESIENYYEYKCPECGEGYKDVDAFKPDENDFYWGECPNCEHKLKDAPDNEPQEIFEWWIVSEFLYKKLKDKGHPVLEWGNNYYWGRCTSGQAIMLDGVISAICAEMEILDGQKYSWAKK